YASGEMRYTAATATAEESDLARYLTEGRRIMAEASPPDLAAGVGDLVDADFELLRWFDLPRSSLTV
ncbi:MAG: aminotransferase, partial [Dermatophilaceae bacterium]